AASSKASSHRLSVLLTMRSNTSMTRIRMKFTSTVANTTTNTCVSQMLVCVDGSKNLLTSCQDINPPPSSNGPDSLHRPTAYRQHVRGWRAALSPPPPAVANAVADIPAPQPHRRGHCKPTPCHSLPTAPPRRAARNCRPSRHRPSPGHRKKSRRKNQAADAVPSATRKMKNPPAAYPPAHRQHAPA